MSYYPVFLDLEGRPVLVVGGGDVARGKIDGLRRAGACVTVIAARVGTDVRHLSDAGGVTLIERPYRHQDVRGFHLVVAATDDAEVNRTVAADAERGGVLVNVVDCAEASSFIAPAVLERGDLQVAVSTSGASPAFAVYLRDRLAAEIGPEYAVTLTILERVRERLRSQEGSLDERKRVVHRLAEAGLIERVRTRDRAAIDDILRSLGGPDWTLEALGVELR